MRSVTLQARRLRRLGGAGFQWMVVPSLLILACPAVAAPIHIGGAWTRPAAASQNGVGYLTMVNLGLRADRLVGADSVVADKVSIHETRMVSALMTMRALDSVDIPAGSTVSFAPGGRHLMLETLKRPLKYGQRIKVTLIFARAGKEVANFTVQRDPPAARPTGMGGP